VERACFATAYVIALFEAYGLADATSSSCSDVVGQEEGAGEGGVGSVIGGESVGSVVGEERAAYCGGRSDEARVVFAESFGALEGTWALGALAHRLLVDTPR
jgi:hypothetical protein